MTRWRMAIGGFFLGMVMISVGQGQVLAPAVGVLGTVQAPAQEVVGLVHEWAAAWSAKDFNRYRSFYSLNFYGIKRTKAGRTTAFNYAAWMDDRRKMMRNAEWLAVEVSNLSVIQQSADEVIVRFIQTYRSNTYSDVGPKVLVFQREDRWRIVFEEMLYANPLSGASAYRGNAGSQVTALVYEWARAWSAKDFVRYRTFYSPDFFGIKRTKAGRTTAFNYAAWMDDRRKMMNNAKTISVEVRNLSIVSECPQEVVAEFTQIYRSDRYSDQGLKVLVFVHQGGAWKIVYEEMIYAEQL